MIHNSFSDEQALQYFGTVMSRSDKNKKLHDIIVGRTHATLYLRWCETIMRFTEAKMATKDSQDEKNREKYAGVCAAIKVLQTVRKFHVLLIFLNRSYLLGN